LAPGVVFVLSGSPVNNWSSLVSKPGAAPAVSVAGFVASGASARPAALLAGIGFLLALDLAGHRFVLLSVDGIRSVSRARHFPLPGDSVNMEKHLWQTP
jgi:hypothetical protein